MRDFFEVEFELESRVLGDIDYHADNPDIFQNFFDFTIEEIKQRYFEFLNLSTEGEDNPEGYEVDNGDGYYEHQTPQELQEHHDFQNAHGHADPLDSKGSNDSDGSLSRELEQSRQETIEEAFTDFNYWKPQVDYNLDQLLSEMNSKG